LKVYISGCRSTSNLCLLFIHGAGSSAFTWHHQVQQFQDIALLIAPDLRGHGGSTASLDMSIDALVEDIAYVIAHLKNVIRDRRVVLVGHSLGGSIAAKLLSTHSDCGVAGLIVLDVAEETAIGSLSRTESMLATWPQSFASTDDYAVWCSQNSRPQNIRSARISTLRQLVVGSDGTFSPRFDLLKYKSAWPGWFQGFDAAFLESEVPKILVLSHVDNIDRALTIAHMAGAFELRVLGNPFRSHFFQEDSPDELLHIILGFLQARNFI
ncbi:unnamed protein product, partial [Ectocarpus fasciculatus]